MAIKLALKSGEKPSRTKDMDALPLNPGDVQMVASARGRHIPPTDLEILDMALNLYANGQLQPVECRRQTIENVKDVPVVTFGFTRTAAARELIKGFKVPKELDGMYNHPGAGGVAIKAGELVQMEGFKLRVRIFNCNEEEAFHRNIDENRQRNQPSDIDDAHNQQIWRDRFNKSDAEIARIYKYPNQNKVARLKKLLELDNDIQLMVHNGILSTNAAIDLLDIDAKDRQAVIKKARKEHSEKVNGARIRSLVRESLQDADDADELSLGDAAADLLAQRGSDNKPSGKSKSKNSNQAVRGTGGKTRTVAELRKFLDNRNGSGKAEMDVPEYMSDYYKSERKWVDGKVSDKAFDNAMVRLVTAGARDTLADLYSNIHEEDEATAEKLRKAAKDYGIEI